ncbi:hypothetical protein J6T21_00730 [Candidatus Saccharibacteria bacterium]|nr:hypothetical protein [Candidatus Saccharibacteria bacterium]
MYNGQSNSNWVNQRDPFFTDGEGRHNPRINTDPSNSIDEDNFDKKTNNDVQGLGKNAINLNNLENSFENNSGEIAPYDNLANQEILNKANDPIHENNNQSPEEIEQLDPKLIGDNLDKETVRRLDNRIKEFEKNGDPSSFYDKTRKEVIIAMNALIGENSPAKDIDVKGLGKAA